MIGLTNRVTNSYFQGANNKQTIAPKVVHRQIQQPAQQSPISFGEGFTLRLIEKLVPGVKKERENLEQTLKEKGKEITNGSKDAINSTVNLIVEKTPTTEPLKVPKPVITPKAAAAINADIQGKVVKSTLETLINNAKAAASTIAELPGKALALTNGSTKTPANGTITNTNPALASTAIKPEVTATQTIANPLVTPPVVPVTETVIPPVAPIAPVTDKVVPPAITPTIQTLQPIENPATVKPIIMPGPPVVQNHAALAQGSNKPVATQPGSLNVVA